MSDVNRQWLLKARPTGMIGPEHFELVESAMPRPDFEAGQVLVKTLMLSFDPAMRGWVMDEPSYLPRCRWVNPCAPAAWARSCSPATRRCRWAHWCRDW